jgi:hypothetical protein
MHSGLQSPSARGRRCGDIDIFEGTRLEAAGYNEAPREDLGWLVVMWEATTGGSTPVHMRMVVARWRSVEN